ncbi:MAG: 4-hydroxyphenylacetate decarboxylase small subunit [Clostridium sp.]
MIHRECVNYINLDCEKGMCAISKSIVPIDLEGSEACEAFSAAPVCGNCRHFCEADKYGIGICKGFEKENWAYETCGAFTCEQYQG